MKATSRGFYANINSKSYSLPYQSNQLQNAIATERRASCFGFSEASGLTLIRDDISRDRQSHKNFVDRLNFSVNNANC